MTEPSLNRVLEIRAKIRTVHLELYLNGALEELAVDPGRTPERVGGVHLPNHTTNLAIH